MPSINNYLKTLSYQYYIKRNTLASINIDRSIKAIIDKLFAYHDNDEINEIFVFGSYSRDTILPRNYDANSDVDMMIVFNHHEYNRTPETYRNWLKEFAENNYSRAEIYKDHPTVVIQLNHINFDLVPAKYQQNLIRNAYYIPNSNGEWLKTDPHKFSNSLVEANKRYGSIVKPIIRMLKAWNAKVGYPFMSYDIEKYIANQDYDGMNIQEGFFHFIKQTNTSYSQTSFQNKSIENLQHNAKMVRKSLKDGDIESAKEWLHNILPL